MGRINDAGGRHGPLVLPLWHSAEVRESLGDPGFTVDDDTLIVAETFRLVESRGPAVPYAWRRPHRVTASGLEAG